MTTKLYSTESDFKELFEDKNFLRSIEIGKYTRNLFEERPEELFKLIQYGLFTCFGKPDYDIVDLAEKMYKIIKKYPYLHLDIETLIFPRDTVVMPLTAKNIYDIVWNMGEFDRWHISMKKLALSDYQGDMNSGSGRCILALRNLVKYFSTNNPAFTTLPYTSLALHVEDLGDE